MSVARIYMDSCIVIYFVEGDLSTRRHISACYPEPSKVEYCTSGLVRLECLTGAHARGDSTLAESYRAFLRCTQDIAIGDSVWDRAAVIRADSKMKLPDALHLAAALESGCDVFWTADKHFQSAQQLPIKIDVTEFF